MVQALKNKLKNEKGFTLIELLAVIVILGILAAIAIPSVLNIIDNSKKDAHVANAQQMISSAKLAVSQDESLVPVKSTSTYINLNYLETNGYLETLKDPEQEDTLGYVKGDSPSGGTTAITGNVSYVKITADANGKLTYSVSLYGHKKDIPLTAEGSIKRSVVESHTPTTATVPAT